MADIEVPPPGASQIVARLLSDALREHPDVQWLGLVSEDGFAIASEGAAPVDDDAVAAGAVRMMIQVRSMAKALGQAGTSQMFLEGGESGICVIDKDPWVLVVMGAPGVPIGLLRYEAREIAEAFPMGSRRALTASAAEEEPASTDWTVVGSDGADGLGADLDTAAEAADDSVVTDTDGEPEFRWADEPTSEPTAAGVAVADSPDGHDIFGDAGVEGVEELEMPSVGADDLSDWLSGRQEPAGEAMFDLAPPAEDAPVTFEMPEADGPVFDVTPPAFDLPAPDVSSGAGFDLPAPEASGGSAYDLPAPGPAGVHMGWDDLSDLAPPSGEPIDLPPPSGPAFELPPPG